MKDKFFILGNDLKYFVRFRLDLAKSLMDANYEVHVAVINTEACIVERLKKIGMKCYHIPVKKDGKNPINDFLYFIKLACLLMKIKPKYLLSYNIKPNIYGIYAAWLAGVPKRFMLISGLGFTFGEKAGALKKLVTWLYKLSTYLSTWVFFQNSDDQMLFEKLKIIKKDHSSVVNGSGVNLSYYTQRSLPTALRFIMIARMLKDKGIQEYIDAAMVVKKQNPEVEFSYVGSFDDNPMSISKSQLELWKASSMIKFYGEIEDVRQTIAESSVIVLPSYREGVPRSVLEAMAMGRAVITTDAPGCRETVKENYNGFLVKTKSVQGLIDAMKAFIKHSHLVKKMGDASRVYAEERFDVEIVNQQMISKILDDNI